MSPSSFVGDDTPRVKKKHTKMQKYRTKKEYFAPLLSERYYHIYNRTNNKEPLFLSDKFRLLFLQRCKDYLLSFVDIFAHCLLDNHFHLMVKVKHEEVILDHVRHLTKKERTSAQNKLLSEGINEVTLHQTVERQFTRLFTSYAMRFNEHYKRKGNLFHRPFKRVLIESEAHYTFLVYYIHANPMKHGLAVNFREYPWSSYRSILSNKPTHLRRAEILDWFGGREAFIEYHNLGERSWKEDFIYLEMED